MRSGLGPPRTNWGKGLIPARFGVVCATPVTAVFIRWQYFAVSAAIEHTKGRGTFA